ncbi:MAG: hypothetical protein EOP83_20060 [Verrucomicrobiaceae bacterium]|nr:MAG: hypothetical protein EOP83_20060 [Verrucomicrobiaceae bacterium]
MSPHIKFLAIALLALTGGADAGTGIFNWEIPQSCSAFWKQDGMVVTNARNLICPSYEGGLNLVSSGSTFTNDVEGLKFVMADGKTFTPVTMDVGEYSISTSISTPVTFIGTKPGGEQVSYSVALDGVRDGPGGEPDFQQVTFPATFQDIVHLEVPTRLWSCDNFVFSGIIPFPLPADQKLEPAFQQGETIHVKPAIDEIYMVGPDFHYAAGFYPPDRTQFMTETDSSNRLTPQMHLDPDSRYLYYVSSSVIRRYRDGEVTDLVALSQMPPEYGITSLSKPRGSGNDLYFTGWNFQGSDSYVIFKLEEGEPVPVVTPSTMLPGKSGPGLPYYFPDWLAVRNGNFAFDTSLKGISDKTRVFASWQGGPLREVIAEGDLTPAGVVPSIDELEFDDQGRLLVQAGGALLICDENGAIASAAPTLVSPVNAGKQVYGKVLREADGTTFLETDEEIYRKHGNDFYRVIGQGDKINDDAVIYLRYLDKRLTAPLRILVEVRLESAPYTDVHVELILPETPTEQPPRIGQVQIHPESGELFLPLSHLTYGRDYWLRRSTNLSNWEDLWKVEPIEPLQHLRIPPELLGEKVFFRVDERPPAGP